MSKVYLVHVCPTGRLRPPIHQGSNPVDGTLYGAGPHDVRSTGCCHAMDSQRSLDARVRAVGRARHGSENLDVGSRLAAAVLLTGRPELVCGRGPACGA